MGLKPIKTGLIGFGLSGRVFHAPFIELAEGFELAAIAQRNSESSRLVYPHAETVRTYQEVLKNKALELVVIATPNETHFQMAKEALLAGKHIIVEKPFAPTLSETEELIGLAMEKNKRLFVFHNRRWDGDFMTVRQVIENGLLGEIVAYEAHYDRFKPELNPKPWKETAGPASGILYDLGTHIIDQAVCLFGVPDSVTAQLLKQRKETKIDDGFDMMLDYGQCKVTLKSTLLAREIGPRYTIYGRQGSFIKSGIDPQEDDMQAGISPLSKDWGKENRENRGILHTSLGGLSFRGAVETIPGNYMKFYDNVYDVIRNEAPYAIEPRSAQITTAIIECAIESNRSRKTVPCKKPKP